MNATWPSQLQVMQNKMFLDAIKFLLNEDRGGSPIDTQYKPKQHCSDKGTVPDALDIV